VLATRSRLVGHRNREVVVMKRLGSSSWVGLVGLCVAVAAAAGACAAGSSKEFTSASGNPGAGGAGGNSAGGGTGEGGVNLTSSSSGMGGEGGGGSCDPGAPDKDNDGDGFTELQGDCNDCNKYVNPNAVEVIAEPDADGGVPTPADEDCDGKVDNVLPPCDDPLVKDSQEPMDAAKAIGLCKFVKTAKWVVADGSPPPVDATQNKAFHLGHGLLPNFGTNNKPQEGKTLLVLSSGTARAAGDPESIYRTFDKGYTSNPPAGFPKESPSCPNIVTGQPHDATGVEFEVNAPSNALSFSFDFQFFTYEWPDFICQKFNDFFVANLLPYPMGQSDGNVAFDGAGNPISVNNKFFDACGCPGNPPAACKAPVGAANGIPFACGLGKTPVASTPFASDAANPGWTHGSTGWLRTTAAVEPGKTFRIRFVTYDSSDGNLDSTTLVDDWKWSGKPGTTETIPIPPK
jgi:hypothetical protein